MTRLIPDASALWRLNITWRREPDGTSTAWIGGLSIGSVFHFGNPEHWYGHVDGHGPIGSCPSEDRAKAEVERIWRTTP